VLLPTAFGRRIQQAAEQRRKQGEQAVRVERAKTKAAMGPKDVGQFEAHTRGIGAKLLSKMGWQEGEGLGRDKRVRCLNPEAAAFACCPPAATSHSDLQCCALRCIERVQACPPSVLSLCAIPRVPLSPCCPCVPCPRLAAGYCKAA
jgi:hypothetical protein